MFHLEKNNQHNAHISEPVISAIKLFFLSMLYLYTRQKPIDIAMVDAGGLFQNTI